MIKTIFSYGRILGLLAVVALTAVSCEKSFVGEDISPIQSKSASIENPCGSETFTLWAGQTMNAGTVTVANDEENIYVTYSSNVIINEVHLFVTLEPLAGRVAPGQAPYKAVVNDYTYTFIIPMMNLGVECGATIYLQAHSALANGETAYGGTITKPKKGSWFGTIGYTVVCCEEEPVTECQEETAFGGNTAVNVDEDGAWFYYFDVKGDATQKIYAGQYIEVGTVTIINGVVTINLTGGWELQDVNEPVKIQGYDAAPTKRLPAGQFRTYKGSDLELEVEVFPYYIIHLDVVNCGNTGGGQDI